MFFNRFLSKSFFIYISIFVLLPTSATLFSQTQPVGRETIQIGPTILQVPKGWRPPSSKQLSFDNDDFNLIIYSRSFSRGELCYIEILPKPDSVTVPTAVTETNKKNQNQKEIGREINHHETTTHELVHIGLTRHSVPLHKFSEGWQAMFLVPPDQTKDSYLTWTLKSKTISKTEVLRIPINLHQFPESKSVLPFAKEYADPNQAKAAEIAKQIAEEREIKNRAFSVQSNWSFTNQLSHPRDLHYLTSVFYSSRLNQRYKEENGKRIYLPPQRSIHRGTDFRGVTGAPIFAVAPGTVVLAQQMYYEGGFTLVDHGNGIKIGYMHQNRIHVKVGDKIQAGQVIGDVGATGMVTGSHLHLSVWVNGIPGDALSLLSLPLR